MVKNEGDASLALSLVSVPAGFKVVGLASQLNPGTNDAFSVTLDPAASAGDYQGIIYIGNNDPDEGMPFTTGFPLHVKGKITAPIIQKPTISISASDASANEAGSDAGRFLVARTGSTAHSLTVRLSIGGTATAGSDYATLPTSVSIPAGLSSKAIVVTGKQDTVVEAVETVTVAVANDNAYTLAVGKVSAQVSITDDDGPTISTISSAGVPFGLLKISGSYDASATKTIVHFTTPDGYAFSESVRPRAGIISTKVPMMVNPKTGAPMGAKTRVAVYQYIGGKKFGSNGVSLKVRDLPVLAAAPGTVTAAFLSANLNFAKAAQTRAKAVGVTDAETQKGFTNQINQYSTQLALVNRLISGRSTAVVVGTADNQPIKLHLSDYAVTDRLISAQLASAAGSDRSPGGVSVNATAFVSAATSGSTGALAAASTSWGTSLGHWLSNPINDVKAMNGIVSASLFTLEVVAAAAALPELAVAGAAIGTVYAATTLMGAGIAFSFSYMAETPAERAAWREASGELFTGGLLAGLGSGVGVFEDIAAVESYRIVKAVSVTADTVGLVSDSSELIDAASNPKVKLSLGMDSSGTGTGTVTSDVNESHLKYGDTVTITATPDAGSKFDHWSIVGSAASSETSTLSFLLARDTTVRATFKDALSGTHAGRANTSVVLQTGVGDAVSPSNGIMTMTLSRAGKGAYTGTVTYPAFSEGTVTLTFGEGTDETITIKPNNTGTVTLQVAGSKVTGSINLQGTEHVVSRAAGTVAGDTITPTNFPLEFTGTIDGMGIIRCTYEDPTLGSFTLN